MDAKRALFITVWIVVASVIGLIIFALLLPVFGGALFLPILLLPPVVALFPADRYRRRSVYLPAFTRFLASLLSVVTLFVIIGVAATASHTEIGGSWSVYSVLAALEFIGIFFVLSALTVKNK